MLATQPEPLLHPCQGCGAMLDVTEEQPFAQVQCPACGMHARVRRQFGQYELQEILGTGGMGAVYKATDLTLNRSVALKLLRREFSANPEFLEKFDNEAKITASINHPHVVKVFSFGEDHGTYYIAMEVVGNGSLDDLMTRLTRIPEAQAIEVAIQVALGLQAAHRVGLIHRDVKPGNILFADAHTSKIVDFGLALLAAEAAEAAGEVWGTPYYVAPEKLRHEPEDFRSDIYSLGGTIFHAIAGEPPLEADTPSLIARRHLDDEPESVRKYVPGVTSTTAYVIDRMLKKNPDERYASYEELIEHLSYARTKLMGSIGQTGFRVVLDSMLEHAVGIVLVVALLVAGVFGFRHRETLFKKPAPHVVTQRPVSTEKTVSIEIQAGYDRAVKLMLGGDLRSAQEKFLQLGRMDAPQPLASWIRFHEGLCALLNDKPKNAESIYKKMSGGIFAAEHVEPSLANFFVSASKLLGDDKPVPTQVAKTYDTPDQEAIALLAFGLKDWDLGGFDDARRFLERFMISEPRDQYAWINEYKSLAEKFMADYRVYNAVATQLAEAATAEKQSALLAEAAKQKDALQTKGAMPRKFAQIIDDLTNAGVKIGAPPSTPDVPVVPGVPTPNLEKYQAEAKYWDVTRAKYSALVANYNFTEARNVLAAAVLTEPDLLQFKTAALRRAELLRIFKAALINDVNALGYPAIIYKKNNISLPAGAHRATDLQVSIVTQFGALPAQWSEISPVSVLTMADYFSKRAADAKSAADRFWLIGVFAVEAGMDREGRAYLDRAAQAKPEYRDQITQLFPDAGTGAPP